jgi:antagonist of KipI
VDRRVKATPTPAVGGFTRPNSRTVTVLSPGLFTTIQDEGRWGYQADGVPVSGALDVVSHRIANAAVGNDRRAAAIEVTLQGTELRFDARAAIAIAGADLGATLDAAPMPMGTGVVCHAGSVLRLGQRRAGARAYVAIDGGVDVPPVLGSRSTHVLSALGGVGGRPLRAGDVVALGAGTPGLPRRVTRRRMPSGGARLRVIAGPHDQRFPAAAIDALHHTRFTISPQSNRMGYRLTGGAPLRRLTDDEMISDATFAGGVQVPPSGDPILLMADRQTTGGYPQIATVISADLPLAAQLAPGDWIEFEPCSRREAIAALAAQEAELVDA